jgi:hypothetical protein
MKNFLSRLSTRKWAFGISIYLAYYLSFMMVIYQREIAEISQKSLKHLGSDISSSLGFFEVLKSAGFSYWPSWGVLTVGVPYLIIAVYFMDFKNEPNAGWRRIYISTQIVIPILYALFVGFILYTPDGFSIIINGFIHDVGISEASVLILIKLLIWIKDGFSAEST